MKRVTIRDLAAAAEVSVTTVSDALNGKGRLSETTRKHVFEVAQELNFRPSNTAKNLNAGRTGVLILAIAHHQEYVSYGWDSEFFLQALGGASEYALSKGYVVAFLPFHTDSPTPEMACDGVIVIDPTPEDLFVNYAKDNGLPLVTLGWVEDTPVYTDNDLAYTVDIAMTHLAAKRPLAPLLVYNSRPTSYVQDILTAYREWCEREAIEPQTLAIDSTMQIDKTILKISDYLEHEGQSVNAVVAAYDSVALTAESACERLGRRVPEDIQLLSLVDSSHLANRNTPITAVDLRPAEVGRELARMLVQEIEKTPVSEERVLVKGELNVRASTL